MDRVEATPITLACTDGDRANSMQSLSQVMDCSQNLPTLSLATMCLAPGCRQAVGFDINTGTEHLYCSDHVKIAGSHTMYQADGGLQVEDIELGADPYTMMYTQHHMLSVQAAQMQPQGVYGECMCLNRGM